METMWPGVPVEDHGAELPATPAATAPAEAWPGVPVQSPPEVSTLPPVSPRVETLPFAEKSPVDITTPEGYAATNGGSTMQPMPEMGFMEGAAKSALGALGRLIPHISPTTEAYRTALENKGTEAEGQPGSTVGGILGSLPALAAGPLAPAIYAGSAADQAFKEHKNDSAISQIGHATASGAFNALAPVIGGKIIGPAAEAAGGKIAGVLGERVGAAAEHGITGAGGGAGLGFAEQVRNTPLERWKEDPIGAAKDLLIATGTGAAGGFGMGAVSGGISGQRSGSGTGEGLAVSPKIETTKQRAARLETENARLAGELATEKTNARTDELTGLGNRLKEKEDVAKITADADATKEHVGFVETDLANFKAVNDHLSHDVGDQVLKEVGNAVRESIRQATPERPADYAGSVNRVGGDEFPIKLRNVDDPAKADVVMQRANEILAKKLDGIIGDQLPKEAYPYIAWGTEIRKPGDLRTPEAIKAAADAKVIPQKNAMKAERGIPATREGLADFIAKHKSAREQAPAAPPASNPASDFLARFNTMRSPTTGARSEAIAAVPGEAPAAPVNQPQVAPELAPLKKGLQTIHPADERLVPNMKGVQNTQEAGVERWMQRDPEKWPPIQARYKPDGTLYVADGNHRIEAAKKMGLDKVNIHISGEPPKVTETPHANTPKVDVQSEGKVAATIPPDAEGESHRPPITHPTGIPIEKNIEDSMGAATLGSPSVAGAENLMGGTLTQAKQAWKNLGQKAGIGKDMLGALSGRAFPTMSRMDRESAEAAVHVRASREYAIARGNEAHEAMIRGVQQAGQKPIPRKEAIDTANKAWAVLTEDNLRGLKQQMLDKGDVAGAKAVRTMIGTAAPGLLSEAQYQATLKDPKVQAAIKAYEGFRPELEEKFQQGIGNQNPNLAAPETRGLQTGVRINLLAKVDSAGDLVNQGPTASGASRAGRLDNPLSRKPKTARAATGTGGAYNINAKEGLQHSFTSVTEAAAKREFANQVEKAGLAEIHRGYGDPVEGRQPIEIERAKPAIDKNGQAVTDKDGKPIMVQPKVMYPKPEIATEVRRVYNLDPEFKIPIVTKLLNSHTGASLIGLGEAVYHTGTLIGGVQRAFNFRGGPVSNTLNSGFIRLGRAVAAVGKEAVAAYRKTPESLSMKSERARVGATRPSSDSKLPGNVYIHGLHEASAAAIQRMVHEAAALGRIPNTETAIRDAITLNLGQYNKGLKGRLTAALQESGATPFLGTQKAQMGLLGRFFTGSTGVKGANASLRANHFANLVGTAMQIGALSYLMSGKFFGRPGVPLGEIDTGKDDKNGNPITIPTTFMLGLTPFKRSGLQKVTTGLRDGRDKGLIAQDTYQEIVRNVTRLAGPGVKSGFGLATGKALDPGLFDITPAPEDDAIPFVENAKSVAAQINSGATKAASRVVGKLGFPDTAEAMDRYAGHPEDTVLQSQLRAFWPTGSAIPNDEARISAQRRDAQKRRAREARKNAQ